MIEFVTYFSKFDGFSSGFHESNLYCRCDGDSFFNHDKKRKIYYWKDNNKRQAMALNFISNHKWFFDNVNNDII